MSAGARERLVDEVDLLQRLVPLERARLIDIGCGKAELSRKLLERGLVRSVMALEVDERQHVGNVSAAHPENLHFALAGAERIPFADESFDVAIMLKSLHHVPIDLLDQALAEIRRVLVPGGFLYVSEPVYAGDFNDIVRLFHDEGIVRAAAYDAIKRATASGIFELIEEVVFETGIHFGRYRDFVERIVKTAHANAPLPEAIDSEVRQRFEALMSPHGVTFVREMRVNVLRRPSRSGVAARS